MGNRPDERGTDVEIYRKALTPTIHIDSRTAAPGRLLDLLDRLGLERQEVRTAGPIYIWHTVPENLDADEQKRLATRAIPALLMAGYKVNCDRDVFDDTAYQQAVGEIRSGNPRHTVQRPAPTASASCPAPPRRTP
ncbi:hypothetical protein ACIQNI_28860 [Streptomyces sp. NPDC091266]|uniref:hypothetical protein n=1 Tax=Streptomyces sp. NPDC091266 TaxID=3365978 RepID=UPI003830079E